MRAVLDTNIFVSGIHWSGASEKVLRAWFLDNFKLISSTDIVDEFVKTMISFKVPMKIEDILWWESLILEKSELVMPRKKVNAVKDDPDDDKFIEAALEGAHMCFIAAGMGGGGAWVNGSGLGSSGAIAAVTGGGAMGAGCKLP